MHRPRWVDWLSCKCWNYTIQPNHAITNSKTFKTDLKLNLTNFVSILFLSHFINLILNSIHWHFHFRFGSVLLLVCWMLSWLFSSLSLWQCFRSIIYMLSGRNWKLNCLVNNPNSNVSFTLNCKYLSNV